MSISTVLSPEHIRKLHFPASLVLRLRLCDWVLANEIAVEENKILQALALKYFPLSPYPSTLSFWHLVECRGSGEGIQRPLSEVAEALGRRKELGFLSSPVVENYSRWLPDPYLIFFVLSGYTLGFFVSTTVIYYFNKILLELELALFHKINLLPYNGRIAILWTRNHSSRKQTFITKILSIQRCAFRDRLAVGQKVEYIFTNRKCLNNDVLNY